MSKEKIDSEPVTALFLIRKDGGIYVVRNPSDSLWTLPGGNIWESCSSLKDFAKAFLYAYFEEDVEVTSLKLVAAPEGKIFFENGYGRFSVYLCRIKGRMREDVRHTIRIATRDTLLPYILSPDVRCIIDHPLLQKRLR